VDEWIYDGQWMNGLMVGSGWMDLWWAMDDWIDGGQWMNGLMVCSG
jgi:hypothetical protein